MSITTEIQRINGGKQAIRTLVSQKNVNIPSTALIDSYASVLGAQWPDCTFNVNYDGDKIRGKTVIFNQMVKNGKFVNGNHWKPYYRWGVTILEISNNRLKYTTRYTYSESSIIQEGLMFKSGHKYLLRYFIELDKQKNIYSLLGSSSSISNATLVPANTRTPIEEIVSVEDVGEYAETFRIGLIKSAEGEEVTCYIDNVSVSDLTDIYKAGNEPSSVNDERIKTLIKFIEDHPDYDSGSLVYSFYKGTKLGEYDYIDTTNNKLVLGGAEVDISQMSLTRFLFGSNYLFYGTNNDQETNTTNVISADYQTAADIADIPDMSVTGNGGTGKTLWFRDDSCTTVEQFKTKNAGKKVYFKLATPTEIDL